MKKYYLIAKNMWDQTFMYRLNFVVWRIRTVVNLLIVYFLWMAILPANKTIFGYTQPIMLTYILGTSLLNAIVLASRSGEVGDEINNGDLSNFLLRPVNYFSYWFSKDIGDKAMNICFSIAELTLLFLILKPPFFLQQNILYLALTFLSIAFGVVLYFFMNFLIGLSGFWVNETWPIRFIFMIIFIQFLGGGLFPLDILPKPIFIIFQLLPTSYLVYFPLKIYLGQLSYQQITIGLCISFVWIFLLYTFVQRLWSRGLRVYTAEGR
jgi:ABC-2 type transport system permease protein